ncbi:MAG: hypothetical protein SGBAC_005470 [Bacillariaceae sp.]
MPQSTITTSNNRRRLSSFEHLNGQEDFHRKHSCASERRQHGWSTRSNSSFTTDDGAGSTSTVHMSNTIASKEKRQKEKRRFLSFTKVLMKFLEKKNPTVCKNARNVILKYKLKKQRQPQHYFGEEDATDDETESMCEYIKVPLKQTVGSAYWKQAKGYLNQMEAKEDQENNISSNDGFCIGFEPLSTVDSNPLSPSPSLNHNTDRLNDSQAQAQSQAHLNNNGNRSCIRPFPSKENQLVEEERKLRKQRFWMVVRVLMRYVEKKDAALYQKARAALQECARRNILKEDRFRNLIESVQRELKQTVGTRYWRRAERHVGKHLIQKANEKGLEDALVKESSSFGPLDAFNPRLWDEQQQHQHQQQQQHQHQHQQHEPTVNHHPFGLETIFEPPRHNYAANWRDPPIPANVAIPTAIPTKRPADDLALECDYHSPDIFSGRHEEAHTTAVDSQSYQDDSLVATEMYRKRRKLWYRPYSPFPGKR